MKLELCVTSPKGIQLAKKYRLDRVELCMNLEQGGTTPSPALVHMSLNSGLETHVLIRPRAGGFVYSEAEKELILAEIHAMKYLGVHGFVVGSLKENKEIDTTLIGEIAKITKGKTLTFHRAFEEMAEWQRGVEVLRFFQFQRILTAGRASNVDMGFENLKEVKTILGKDIELMIGGGINEINAPNLIKQIQPDAIHFSASTIHLDSNSMFGGKRMEINENRLVTILKSISLG